MKGLIWKSNNLKFQVNTTDRDLKFDIHVLKRFGKIKVLFLERNLKTFCRPLTLFALPV